MDNPAGSSKYRRYVKMEVVFDIEGNIIPTVLHWSNGRKYPIDSVKKVCHAPSLKAGGQGLRFTCMISGKEKFIWMDGDSKRWFVEAKEAQ